MKASIIGLVALFCFAGAVSPPAAADMGTVFEAPFDPAHCGERLNRLYDGEFESFWNFIGQQGFAAAPEFIWSVPILKNEAPKAWQDRARECVIEIERANQRDDRVETRYAVGYALWFGTPTLRLDREEDGTPSLRERAFRMVQEAAKAGSRPAIEALTQIYVEMVRITDRRRAYGGKTNTAPTIPKWFPPPERILAALDRQAKSGGLPRAFLAIALIYSERRQLADSVGYDHQGRAVSEPDPRLRGVIQAYERAWRDGLAPPPDS